MRAPPPDISTGDITGTLRRHWGIEVDAAELRYVPVGFGSHHWRAWDSAGTGWFVTVDACDEAGFALRRAAFRTAVALQQEAKLPFVLAPVANDAGEPLRRLGEGYALSVTPWVDGAALGEGPYANDVDAAAVLRLLGMLHDAGNVPLCPDAPYDDLAIPYRDALERALDDTTPWHAGPYAASAFALMHKHRSAIRSVLVRYDELATVIAQDRAR